MSQDTDHPASGTEETEEQQALEEALATRREFTRKFGNYAASAPLGMYMLMSPRTSSAQTDSAA